MNSFWTKLKAWFKPSQKKPVFQPKLAKTQPTIKLANAYQPINHQHYRQLINKLAREAIAIQRARKQRRSAC